MSSFTTITNDSQNRTQRRLLFEGFNVHDPVNSSHRHHSSTMVTSTPDHRLYEKENEQLDLIQTNDLQATEPCLLQLQNARQLLHSMSRTNTLATSEQPLIDDQQPRTELLSELNPELVYYKSSLESERSRRKQLETLIDVQQQRLSEAESELIQLRANDHKKTLCMKQLEQMIPNVVDEWKQKENDYKLKLNNLTQQLKQIEQTNREKLSNEKQQFDEQLNEKISTIERLTKDNEKLKQDYDNGQSKIKQYEQRIQQLTKDFEQAKQQWSTVETDLRNELRNGETRLDIIRSESDEKQQEIEQMLRDQHKHNSDHQHKVRQLENELDEQRRENVSKYKQNVLKMELELREAKYRAQTESLKIQLIRDAETKLTQRLDEQHKKHIQIEEELNELHRRKLLDLDAKHEQILSNERHEHENRVHILRSKIDQTKNEIDRIQSTTQAERQDLAKKLQDVFETALFQGTTKTSFSQNEIINSPPPPPPPLSSRQHNQIQSQGLVDTQIKGNNNNNNEFLHSLPLTNIDHPDNMSAIRSLSSRIDSLVDQTNRVANGFELNSRLPSSSQQENTSEWNDNNQNRLLSSRPQSALQSPFYRSTPIDPLQDWYPQTSQHSNNNYLTNRSQSTDVSNNGLFSNHPPPHNYQPQQQQQQQHPSTNSYSLDSNLNTSHYHQQAIPTYRSSSSITSNLFDNQQEIQATISKDSIERQQYDQTSSTNESLSRYVKMLLERPPNQEQNLSNNHPLAKTNRSLQNIQQSIEQLNLAERDLKPVVDDLVLNNHSPSPRQHKPSITTSSTNGAKKKLDYDVHNNNNKQSNTTELFERLSQPKTRIKKDKPKQQQQQSQQQPQQQQQSTSGIWK
ncbi:unnamed protein product [Adineta steineri]|uniref:Uncharacterized protein n=1 Tax=Adineta steineri TaxID=433720 RepID=A0A813MLQ0_9BILA|nr:unnamed protein product [Adineta steineri]CAF3595327.1 unnamed protein product [Adineta steineri]